MRAVLTSPLGQPTCRGSDSVLGVRLYQELLRVSQSTAIPFLSSHPSGQERIANMQRLIDSLPPSALAKSQTSIMTASVAAGDRHGSIRSPLRDRSHALRSDKKRPPNSGGLSANVRFQNVSEGVAPNFALSASGMTLSRISTFLTDWCAETTIFH